MTSSPNRDLLYRDEVYAIQGAIYEVYREMGCGFLEAVYQECLAREFHDRQVPFVSQPNLTLNYKGKALEQVFRPDFVCFGLILMELKAVRAIAPEHQAQVINYLKATGLRLGLLVNFGHYPKVNIGRFAL